jgi:predicted  nucleic acid-binding Zn-ribbon protein
MSFFTKLRLCSLALAGATAIAAATPAAAGAGDVIIEIGEDGDLLDQLIALDRQGIEDMRAEFAAARAEIAAALVDIRSAREDVKSVPGGRVILKIAFASARAGASAAVDEALADARAAIDDAERDLADAAVSEAERTETQDAIRTLRAELSSLESALRELLDALEA